jgi:peptidoglycan DL-endopeptidase LytE
MNLVGLIFARTTVRQYMWIVGGILVFVITLPIVALLAVTNVGALAGSTGSSIGSDPSNVSLYNGSGFLGDTYAFGNCTYWVFMRRAQVGEAIPTTWGNAATWASRATADGYVVNHIPSQYAIMQTPNSDGGLGHVAFVESIDPDGTWHISEMNVVGFDEVDDRAMPASAASEYWFIHSPLCEMK